MTNQTIQQYIERYIDGTITQREWEELRIVLNKSENEHLLNDIIDKQLAAMVVGSSSEDEAVTKKLLSSILKKISADKIASKNIAIQLLPTVKSKKWLVAASIAALLGLTTFFLIKSTNKETKSIALAKTPIKPGKKGAILTLSDSRKILLDTVESGLVVINEGLIANVSNGTLKYPDNNGENIYNTINTGKGRKFSLILPDGTQVWLNAESSIYYPTSFQGNERVVEIKGEAYFEVAKYKKKPFLVKVDNKAIVEVLGTKFNVDAYANETNVKVTLMEGSVNIKDLNRNVSVLLTPGKQVIISKNKAPTVETVERLTETSSWKEDVFIMEKMDVQSVMNHISRWYDVEVVYPDGVPVVSFTGDIPASIGLKELLQVLELSGIKCKMEDRKIIVFK
jgi:transmembrane sensor